MILQQKTLEKLRELINEETQYRKGHELVAFFNNLGFNDTYGQGFPSRWIYTDEKLRQINGTPELDKCIKYVFNPINFVKRINQLDNFIQDFNKYLIFDKWKVLRINTDITFQKVEKIEIDDQINRSEISSDEFLKHEFADIKLEGIGLDSMITEILELRFEEIKSCLNANAPLSVIFLCGSTLEGILLGIATKNPREFNQAKTAPKNTEGKCKKFHEWTLNNLIDTAHEIGLLKEDVKKFSHSLRDFRNYIHPYEQLSSRFNPDKQTAKISWQVLKAAIFQLTKHCNP